MSNWTPIKPKFKKECLLLTASKYKEHWEYKSWSIVECDDMDNGGWYFALCDIDGDEWGDIDDLKADLYKVISLPK